MSSDIGKLILETLTLIFNNDSTDNMIIFKKQYNTQLTQLFNNLKSDLANKNLNNDTIKLAILNNKYYHIFCQEFFINYFINTFQIDNNDINLELTNYISNLYNNNTNKTKEYGKIDFFQALLTNNSFINDWKLIINFFLNKIYNIQISFDNHNISNIIHQYIITYNFNIILQYLVSSTIFNYTIELKQDKYLSFFINIFNIFLQQQEHNLSFNSINTTNYYELINQDNILTIKELFNEYINHTFNNKQNDIINQIFYKDCNILDNPLSYINQIQTSWKYIYNYNISSFKLFQFILKDVNYNFNQFNLIMTNNLYSNNILAIINHLYTKKFERHINIYELTKYYMSFLFIIYQHIDDNNYDKFIYKNNIDVNYDEFNNFSDNKQINNYYNFNIEEFKNIQQNQNTNINNLDNTDILSDNEDITDKDINQNKKVKKIVKKTDINKLNIIDLNSNNVNIIYQYIDYNNPLMNELSNFINNIYDKQLTTYQHINQIYQEYLLMSLDMNTYFNKYLVLIENTKYKTILIDKFINCNIYKQNIYNLINKIFMEYYEITLDKADIEYIFDIIYNKKLPSIETEDLRNIIANFKLDTDKHYDITLKVYQQVLERHPDINEIYYYKHLFRQNQDIDKSTTTLYDNLYNNIEYNEILKNHIKILYKKIHSKDILPSILYKILNNICNDNDIKKDTNLIENYIKNLDQTFNSM